MTDVVLTGTGVPRPDPKRAGAGTLVRHDDVAVQFDAGRATAMRLAEVGVAGSDISALFITHHHSDHLAGLVDIVMSRWLDNAREEGPLTIVAPEGPATRFAETMLDPYVDDIAVRSGHGPATRPEVTILGFDPSPAPTIVWEIGEVRVSAVTVHHEPVLPAVAYRVDTPDGSVVISGDTVVCDEVQALADGVDVLVHEVVDREVLVPFFDAMPALERICSYHAEVGQLGALAEAANVKTLMLTHLVPAPANEADEQRLADKIKAAGFSGEIVVGRDLSTVTF